MSRELPAPVRWCAICGLWLLLLILAPLVWLTGKANGAVLRPAEKVRAWLDALMFGRAAE